MKRYEIRCTPEQTKKALALGAIIREAMSKYNAKVAYKNIEQGKESLEEYINNDIAFIASNYSARAYRIPTAEQMLGWLRSKGFRFSINDYGDSIAWKVVNNTWVNHGECAEPIKATLAAIDAALEYLIQKEEK